MKEIKPCPNCGQTLHRFTDGTFNRCLRCQYQWNEKSEAEEIKENMEDYWNSLSCLAER